MHSRVSSAIVYTAIGIAVRPFIMHVREIKTAGMHSISFEGGEAGAALVP